MTIDSVREFCLSLPHATEDMKWGDNLLFRVGGKMFALMTLDPDAEVRLSFKCTPEKYAELLEQQGIVPAPYLARAHWVGVENLTVLFDNELSELLRQAYETVLAGLPRKKKEELNAKRIPKTRKAVRRKAAR
jgi:predicted DNA-binding protein (MmcQ/YjbR family)